MFEDAEKYLVSPSITVRNAIAKIDSVGRRTVIITDDSKKLIGVFTDADMRSFVVHNGDLDAPVKDAMNKNPIYFYENQKIELEEQIKKRSLLVYPIVNEKKEVVKIACWTNKAFDVVHPSQQVPEKTTVIIMAGGKGERLYPITKVLPKALVPVEDVPICTRVINSFKRYNCRDFYLILNHKSEMIKSYYNDIQKDFNLFYETEKEFLGTAGGLYLLKNKIKNTCFVTNCDILVEVDYSRIYKWHKQENNLITVVCAIREFTIPYGTIDTDKNGRFQKIKEKPNFSFLVNVGVYLLEPNVINELSGGFVHMTDLVQEYAENGQKVGVFPVSGDGWLDMGQFKEMEIMSEKIREKYRSL